ncbi:MAG: hypothetical protein ACRC8S_03785 [Fimbriiglobus sp.]
MSTPAPIDSVNSAVHPFGLPLGTVRAFMALLILGNFWLVVLWPHDSAKPLLGHFVMLPLILYSFTLSRNTHPGSFSARILPFLLRLLFTGGTVAVIAFMVTNGGIGQYKDRLTPSPEEFKDWWLLFGAALAGGLLAGVLLNSIFGPDGSFFRTLRAWLSVVSMVFLTVELGLFVIHLASKSPEPGFVDFLRNYQLAEVAIVSAYFGTRI